MRKAWEQFRASLWKAKAGTPTPVEEPLSEEALKAALAAPCQPFTVGGFRPTNAPTASVFGGVRVAGADADWPTHNGKPLLPLFQLNLKEAPFVPDTLHDLAMVQAFVAEDIHSTGDMVFLANTESHGAPLVIRTFTDLDGLSPITAPAQLLKPFEIAWDAPMTDYANNDVAENVDRLVDDVYAYDWAQQVHTSKLGGWPATIQSEPWWDYKRPAHKFAHAIQIAPEPKSGWGADILFLARAKDDPRAWAIDIQMF